MPYCHDCGERISGSDLYCGSCANEIIRRSRDRIRSADEDEQRRMANDHDYAHSWLQSLIGWIIGLIDLIRPIFSGGCFITSAVVAFKGLDDNSYEMRLLRQFRESIIKSKIDSRIQDLNEYSTIGEFLRNWINSRSDSFFIWEFVWQYVQNVIDLIKMEKYDEAYSIFKSNTLKLKFDVLMDKHLQNYN